MWAVGSKMAHGQWKSIEGMEKLTQSQNKMVCTLDCLAMAMEKSQITLKPEDEEDTDSAMLEDAGSDDDEKTETEAETEGEEDGGGGGSDADANNVGEVAEEETVGKRKGKKRRLE